MELEVTWSRAIKVWWAYAWRNLLAVIVVMLISVLVGGIIGFILGMLGVPVENIKIITMPFGGIIGLAISIVPIKMILGKDFGEFRLVLIQKNTNTMA